MYSLRVTIPNTGHKQSNKQLKHDSKVKKLCLIKKIQKLQDDNHFEDLIRQEYESFQDDLHTAKKLLDYISRLSTQNSYIAFLRKFAFSFICMKG